MPPMATKNDMGVDEVPPELQGLNWVETTLIQLAKPFLVGDIFHNGSYIVSVLINSVN